MAAKIRKDDEVIVIAGKDKGKNGKVLKVIPSEHRVIVEGINKHSKHQKANPAANQEAGIISKEAPLDISNVAIYNPDTQKADRVGFKFEDGKKVRVFKSNGALVPSK